MTGDGRLICVHEGRREAQRPFYSRSELQRVIISRGATAVTISTLNAHRNPSQIARPFAERSLQALKWYESHLDRFSRVTSEKPEQLPGGYVTLDSTLRLVSGLRLKAHIEGGWHDVTLVSTHRHATLIIHRDQDDRELLIGRQNAVILAAKQERLLKR